MKRGPLGRVGLAGLCGLALALAGALVAREPSVSQPTRTFPPRSTLPLPAFASPALAADALWDDGQAEFSLYRGTIRRYGDPRDLEARIIVVKEDLLRASRVKSDRGPLPGRTEVVLKINYQHEFPTGVYTYQQMSSVFLARETLEPRKLAMSSMESCGLTFVEVLARGRTWRHVSHSYFEGEADRSLEIRVPDRAQLWDGLPFWLRTLDLEREQSFAIRFLPSQVGNRVPYVNLVTGRVRVTGQAEDLSVPVGRRRARRVEVAYPLPGVGGPTTDTFWFDAERPHVLLKLERPSQGYRIELTRTTRMAYWEKHRPGDERLLSTAP